MTIHIEYNANYQDINAINIDGFTELLNTTLEQWGRSNTTKYLIFQPIVDLRLNVVEKHANHIAESEKSRIPYFTTMPYHRLQAAWELIYNAIGTLRPRHIVIQPEIDNLLENLPNQPWPKEIPVPRECRGYLILSYAYIWNEYDFKAEYLAESVLGISYSARNIYRREALRTVAQRILDWNEVCDSE